MTSTYDSWRGAQASAAAEGPPLTRLDVVPGDFLPCPDDDCGASAVLMLPDGALACAGPDCCVRRGTWIQP